MPSNRKLTRVIKGRVVQNAAPTADNPATFQLDLDDGSKMKIKVGDTPPSIPEKLQSPIKAVRQNEVAINFDLESGETLAFPLAEATSSVLLRDKDGGFEYAD